MAALAIAISWAGLAREHAPARLVATTGPGGITRIGDDAARQPEESRPGVASVADGEGGVTKEVEEIDEMDEMEARDNADEALEAAAGIPEPVEEAAPTE